MKTKIGKILLKKHSKEKDRLNRRFADIAKKIDSLDELDIPFVEELLLPEARENRKKSEEHQEVINLLCHLDHFLDLAQEEAHLKEKAKGQKK